MKHITNCIIIVIEDNVYNVKHTNCYRWWFVGGCVTGLTLAISWYKLPVELKEQLKKEIVDFLSFIFTSPKQSTFTNKRNIHTGKTSVTESTDDVINKHKEMVSQSATFQPSSSITTESEAFDESIEEHVSLVQEVLKDAPVSSTESSSSQVIQDSEQNNKTPMQQSDALSNKKIWKQLSLPCCFKGLSREEASKAIDELYKALSGKYISCSSRNYFYYVFGGISLPNEYCPPSDSFISCNKGEAFLRTLIKILYNEKNGRVPRGTWIIAENIFLVNGEKIHTRLGQNTNKASVHYQREVNSIVKGVLNKVKSR